MSNDFQSTQPVANNETVLRHLAARMNFKTSPKVRAEMEALQARYNAITSRLGDIAANLVRQNYEAANRRSIEEAIGGQLEHVRDSATTKSQVRERMVAERQTLKTGLRQLSGRALALAEPEVARLLAAGTGWLEDYERGEAEAQRAWDLPYTPGPIAAAVRAALQHLRGFLRTKLAGLVIVRPDGLLPWL